MHKITVNKQELLDQLHKNLKQHSQEYLEASTIYPQTVARTLRERAAQIDDSGYVDLVFDLPKPLYFGDQYDDAIQMLQWEQSETVELDAVQFKQFVQDEWRWKNQFIASTQNYNAL